MIGCGDGHVGRGISGGRGIGWVYVIMGWISFSRRRLLATEAEGGRGSVGAGGPASKMG